MTRFVSRAGTVEVETRPRATLGPWDVRVEVDVAGLGSYPPSGRDEPIGNEYSGRIVEIGTDVEPWRMGTRVVGVVRSGSAASELVVPARAAYPLADRFRPYIAPLCLTAGLCALCFDRRFEIDPGRVALVLSPTNGTGALFAGMVRRRGGTAVAWTRDASAVERLLEYGFAEVIVGAAVPEPAVLQTHTGGRLADVVIGSRMTPEAPWAVISSLLSEQGVAVRRPATPLGDWDPTRAEVYEVLRDAMVFFGSPGGFIEDALAEPLHRLGDDLRVGDLTLPVRAFGLAQAQTAFELSTDTDLPEAVILDLRSDPT